MPAADADLQSDPPSSSSTPEPASLPFPPITKSHILNCSVHSWYPHYRKLTPKTRLTPLSASFISYLCADGILLPPEPFPDPKPQQFENNTGFSDSDSDSSEEPSDPSASWPEIHAEIQKVIRELGGRVSPKLNWSAPKDATWIAATNSTECTSANDIYLLLKSSDFVSHDLEAAFDECVSSPTSEQPTITSGGEIPFHLVLRKTIPALITSMEFRCFVRNRRLVGVSQRELNHYDFLPELVPVLQELIYDFFEEELKETFPDENFVFDIYVPKPTVGGRVWLIDINPWAARTDPLLWSWLELLTMADLPEDEEDAGEGELGNGVVRLSLSNGGTNGSLGHAQDDEAEAIEEAEVGGEEETLPFLPEIRLVRSGDPETYSFNTPLYSAHKLPKDVVDAGMAGEGGIRDFLERVRRREREPGYSSDDEDGL